MRRFHFGTLIRVGQYQIGPGHPPFIIAEMSGNHNGSFERAINIVEAAAKAGAHALKLQTYTADTMTLNLAENEFFINDPASLWKGQSLYDLYKKAYTPWEWHKPIFKRCRELGMIGFSTPFDATAVDFLESLNVPLYKIASFENIDLPLIQRVAATGKPMIISTGMANAKEITEAVGAARKTGCKQLILLKCTSAYPAPPEEVNLTTIPAMRAKFRIPIGLSDHTEGTAVSIASVAFGAVVIERHLTLRREDGGVDSAFSLEPEELADLVRASTAVWKAIGHKYYGPGPGEQQSLVFRRSLYVAQDMMSGERFTPANLRSVRPGKGLPPKFYNKLLGRSVNRAVRKGTPVTWDLVGRSSLRIPAKSPQNHTQVFSKN